MKTSHLSKKYSDKELAESFVFRNKLTKKQKENANKELIITRKKVQGQMTPKQQLLTHLLQLRFQIEDYANTAIYDDKLNFGYFLKEYLKYLHKKKGEFASDINVHHTELSQIINNRRSPSDKFIIRLEIHSNKTIPAIAWYKLLEKEKEHLIATNSDIRKSEGKFVKNKIQLGI